MKKIVLGFFACFVLSAPVVAQTPIVDQDSLPQFVTSEEYRQRKIANTLVGNEVILSDGMIDPDNLTGGIHYVKHFSREKAYTCGGYFDPPGPAIDVTSQDDGWAEDSPFTLPFNFCFFGENQTQVWINNNGNISFSGGIAAFTPSAFPSTGNEMVAAFWSDFDFGGGGTLHATITPTALIVNWVNVGYFSSHGDKRNTCQIVITDGTDPLIPGGNCAIHYDDMQWTTGDASSGTNGFGGTPATAGVNRGNNLDYFTIGRFDHEGTDYDGPLGADDGVSFLDNKSFSFDLCAAVNGNLDPVPTQVNGICDSIYICSFNDIHDIAFPFLSPENNQTTSITWSSPTLVGVQELSNDPGSLATLTLRIDGSQQTPGWHQLFVTATDDFVPPASTAMTYNVFVAKWDSIFPNPLTIDYTLSCSPITYSVGGGGPFTEYDWSTGDDTPTTTITGAFNNNLSVTVMQAGCFNSADSVVYVPTPPAINLSGSNFLCLGVSEATLWLADSANLGDISWSLPSVARDTMYINKLLAGNYTITLEDTTGLCVSTLPVQVMAQALVNLVDDTVVCQNVIDFNGNLGGAGTGQWTVAASPPSAGVPVFADPNDMNTTVTFPAPGNYYLIYTQNNCGYDDTVRVTNSVVNFVTTGANFYCPGQLSTPWSVNNPDDWGAFQWTGTGGTPNPPTPTASSTNLIEGTYTLVVTDTTGFCTKSQNISISSPDAVALQNDTVICESPFTFTYNHGGSGSGNWTYGGSPTVPPTFNSTNLNTTVTFGAFGLYQLIFADAVCNEPKTINVLYRPAPPVNVASEFLACTGLTERAFLPDSASFESVSWGITPVAADTLFAANLVAGNYHVEIVTADGCEIDTTFSIANYPQVELYGYPHVCGDSVEFEFNSGPELGQWSYYNSAGTVNFRDDNDLNTGLDVSAFGVYNLVFTDAYCNDRDTLTLNFIAYVGVDLYDTMNLCIDKTLEIPSNIFNPDYVDDITWSTGATTPTITVSSGGYYSMEVSNICNTYIDSVFIDMKTCDVELPNVFTPGANGVNTVWTAIEPDPTIYTYYNCTIVNRWGNLIYEINAPNGSWDGKDMAGSEVDEGVYFYIIKLTLFDGEEKVKNGFIHLIRD